MLKVLLAGGGTAGHLNPALAIADIIKKHHPDAKFLFAGTPFGIEAKLIAKTEYDFAPITVHGFQRRLSVKNIARNVQAMACLMTASPRARHILKEFQPDLVIGTGGYVSGPVVLEASKMGIPTAIHEPDAFPGMTTRLLAKHVDEVMLTVEEARAYLDQDIHYTVTGLPVRSGISSQAKAIARKELGLDDSMCILSFGGSLGAGCINDAAAALIAWHTGADGGKPLSINHIHGYGGNGRETFLPMLKEKGVDLKNRRLRISEYIDNMPSCMAAADLVICRSGANTLSELETMGRGSILIPSPVVANNHQYHNAMVLGRAGAAIVMEQKDLTPEWLIGQVKTLYDNRGKLASLSQNAYDLAIRDVPDRVWNVLSGLLERKGNPV